MLDHLVAGGLPHGIACGDNIVKECEEEAGIPRSISMETIPVSAVSYMDIDGYRYKRDVLCCSDLKLPEGFIPENQDGEVESFKLTCSGRCQCYKENRVFQTKLQSCHHGFPVSTWVYLT